jgi:hypothetical protein
MKELHAVKDGPQLEYYVAVFDSLKRYLEDAHPFALVTEPKDGRTAITFLFDSADLSPYMAHLDHSLDVAANHRDRAGEGVGASPDGGLPALA